MSADALVAAYQGRFPVLQKYEAVTWFDADGWKLAGNARTFGQRQTKETWAQLPGTGTRASPAGRVHTAVLPGRAREGDASGARGVPAAARNDAGDRMRPTLEAEGLQGEPCSTCPRPTPSPTSCARGAAGLPGRRGVGMFRGPFLRIRTPFRPATSGGGALGVAPPAVRPYQHQARAFARLTTVHGQAAADAGDHRHRIGQDRVVPLPGARSLPARTARRPSRGQGGPAVPDERARHRPGAADQRAAPATRSWRR